MLAHIQKIVYLPDARSVSGAAEVILPPPNKHTDTVHVAFKNSLFKIFGEIMERAVEQQRGSGQADEDTNFDIFPAATSKGVALDASDSVSESAS